MPTTFRESKIRKHKRILRRTPDAPGAHLELGRLYFQNGEYAKALHHLRIAEKQFPGDPTLRNLIGEACFKTGHLDEAGKVLEELLAKAPHNLDALVRLSKVYLRQNRLDQAITSLSHAVTIQPDAPELINDLGAMHFARGNFAEAETCFRKAVTLDANYALGRENLISLFMECRRFPEAREEAKKYMERFPDDFRGFRFRGLICREEGELDDAIRFLAQAKEKNPEDFETCYQLGICAMSRNDLEGAVSNFRSALEQNPHHTGARERLTACYCKIEGADKAFRTLEKSFRKEPAATPPDGAIERETGKELSILLPAFNESDKILSNLRAIRETALALGGSFEIVVVDDGSEDDTYPIAELASREMNEVRVYRSQRNIGKGMALREAALKAEGKRIVFLDADLELPPHLIRTLLEWMDREKADVVLGSKRHPESKIDYPRHRKIISNLYYVVNRCLFGIPVKDTQTGIKLFKRKVLEDILPRLIEKKYAFDLELIVNAHNRGYRIVEAPIVLNYSRKKGRIGLKAIWRTALDTLAIFYRLRILRYYDRERPALTRYPRCSVIIPFRDFGRYPREALAHCLDLDYPDFEVLLLPDGPIDLPGQPGLRVIPTGPVPPSAKRDVGAREATGEILCFLDDDAYPRPEWLQRVVRNFSDREIAAVGGPATTPPDDNLRQQLSGSIFSSLLVSGTYAYRYLPMNYREVDDFPSCNFSVRKEDFAAVGGFDTQYWPGEDTILCRKIIRDRRKKIVYDPEASVFHHRRELFGPHLKQVRNYALHRGFFARHFPENSLKAAYFVPTIFVVCLVAGAGLSLAIPSLRPVYIGGLGIYFLAATAPFLLSLRPLEILTGMIGVFLTHITYGIYFLKGILSRSLEQ